MAACNPEPEGTQPREVREQLGRILDSDAFHKKEMLSRFLSYVVESTLKGNACQIKQTSIGIDALGYPPGADSDATVRTHAGRLRKALDAYYSGPGQPDSLRIELPKGQYVPVFSRVAPPAEQAEPAGMLIPAAPPAPRIRRYAAAAFICLCALAAAYILRGKPAEVEYRRLHLHQLTLFAGDTHAPAPSRDGTLVAYSSDHLGDGGNDIWLKSMSEPDRDIRLTNHPADDYDPDISPDNQWVVYRSTRDGGGLYIVSTAGGEERKLGPGFLPRISPDGRRIAHTRIESSGNVGIFVIPFEGGEPRKISVGLAEAAGPVWDPDGTHLIAVGRLPESREYDWWILAANGSEPPVRTRAAAALRPFVSELTREHFPGDWTANTILFGNVRLFEVSLDSSMRAMKTVRILHPGPGVFHPRYRREGSKRTVLFSLRSFFPHIWGLAAGSRQGRMARERQQWTNDQYVGQIASLSRDGKKLAYGSSRNGDWQIFIRDVPDGRDMPATPAGETHTRPVLNRNGARLACLRELHGSSSIVIVEISSGQTRTVCGDCGQLRDWSDDEKRIVAVRGHALLDVDAVARSIRTVVEADRYDFQEAAWSPDGKWIAAVVGVAGKTKLQGVVLPSQGAPESSWIPITEELYDLALRWSPDGNLLYFLSRKDDFRCLWAQRLHPATKRPLGASFAVEHFHPPKPRILSHGWASVGGNWFAVNATHTASNVFVLTEDR